MDMSAQTYQVGTHFAALIEGILMEPLKTIERFFLHFEFSCRTVFFVDIQKRMRWQRENEGYNFSTILSNWKVIQLGAVKNMDMELIQYMIKVFSDYYPDVLNYILVFEMPWVLNGK